MLSFQERVLKFEHKLNDTDDQIVEYIEKNKQLVVGQSIQSLAAVLYTVPNTIVRLSRKLGYDGFSQLKNSLKEELEQEEDEQVDSLPYRIQKTFAFLDPEKIALVAKKIQEAKRVFFFGVGDTSMLCEMMVKNLKVVGKRAEFYLHRHEIVYEIQQLHEQGLFFLISLSGETEVVLEMAKLAKEQGLLTVSLTHFEKNSLQELADINLYSYSPRKRHNGYNVTDKIPSMIVLQTLSEYYWEELESVSNYIDKR